MGNVVFTSCNLFESNFQKILGVDCFIVIGKNKNLKFWQKLKIDPNGQLPTYRGSFSR